ncbi:hypothetical protein NE237_029670 [Protea cynaroides]|uniref:Pentatricopeptide repeat-containing protein n=1 Tax=Protea cynaroides TaxID=273540 RepID=A0A9Q0GUB4_9MAGN|nr:hypothetical protein NE237_029670 [Protea cynaroides]
MQIHQKIQFRALSFRIAHATDYSSRKDVVSWTQLISALAKCGSSSEMALLEASQMRRSGIKPNSYTMVCLIQASTNLGYTSYVQQLHGCMLQCGFSTNVFVSTALINCYSKWELFNDAHKVFEEIPQPNIVSWNSLISGYLYNEQFHKAVSLVLELNRTDLRADSYTLSAALAASAQLSFLELGKSFHSVIVKFGLGWNVVVGNCLIDMYGKCRFPEEAIQVFHEVINKDCVSWNSVIGASARNGRLEEALSILLQMPVPDTISYNEVINGIAQFGNIEDAIDVLSRTPKPSVASWNSIVTGYVNRDRVLEALDFFRKMHSKDIRMDEFTFASILRGIAGISALTWGTLIHCCLIKSGWNASIVTGSALIDVYSKCGQVNSAESVFCSMPRKNLVSWNAMISGYAHNGNTSAVIRLFEQMKVVQEPDGISYLSVLSACGQDVSLSHMGIGYLESMTRDYGIEPTAEHCSCIIRVLGQTGEVEKAERMIHEMGFGSCGLVWRALLGAACRASGDVKIAKIAAAKVIELEGDDEFVYVLLSNLYASHGKWGEVSAVREMMRERGLRKEAGCSWIEVENVVSTSDIPS